MSGPAAPNATVSALHTAAIKGTRLRSVERVELDERGAAGDRKLFVMDARGRMLNGKQLGELQRLCATLDDSRLTLELPGREAVAGELATGEQVTARFYSHELPGRLVIGPWADALSEYLGRPVQLVAAGSAVDRGARGAVSLVSRGSLRRLAEQAQTDSVDGRRFRMMIEVDGVEPHAEDGWLGQPLAVGEALLRFDGNVGRCLVTSRDPETGEVTLPTLDLLRGYRGGVEATEPLPFGIYGRVLRGGTVRVGDRLELR